jgi:hypothetical protein
MPALGGRFGLARAARVVERHRHPVIPLGVLGNATVQRLAEPPLDGRIPGGPGDVRMEATAIADLLGAPVRPLVCVHGAHVDFAGLAAGDVEILPAGRLVNVLTAAGPQLSSADVAALVAHANTMLRPA